MRLIQTPRDAEVQTLNPRCFECVDMLCVWPYISDFF